MHIVSGLRRTDSGQALDYAFTLTDVGALERSLAQMTDCRLMIVDPIGSFLPGETDAHRDNEVRAVLGPVAALARKYGPAVLVVAHRRKAAADFADDLALGSRAFTGFARAVWHLTRDAQNQERRLFVAGKLSLAPDVGGLAFVITGNPPLLAWEREPIDMRADEAVEAERTRRGPEPVALTEAVEWLRRQLADGPVRIDELKESAEKAGVSWRTANRARRELGIQSRKPIRGAWQWSLPEESRDLLGTQELK